MCYVRLSFVRIGYVSFGLAGFGSVIRFGHVLILLVTLRLVMFGRVWLGLVSICSVRLGFVLFMFDFFWLGLTMYCLVGYYWLRLGRFGYFQVV
jgi:hypothetical protein